MKLRRHVLLAACLLLGAASAHAFEADVHFGLTKWLALKAGFTEPQADSVATGNQRVDAGIMDSVELVLEYACLGKHADASRVAQLYHFAGNAKAPALPAQRAIVAGGAPARKVLDETMAQARQGKADVLLLRLGQALNVFQDSWSYQGTPDVPDFADPALACDATLAWAAPAERGGWNSHKPDHTHAWSADTLAMAEATYGALVQYPVVGGAARKPADWATLKPLVANFARAISKSDKAHWFRSQGLTDISFLGGISLPDGRDAAPPMWEGRRLPPLTREGSPQYDIATDALEFYNTLFRRWLGGKQPDATLGQLLAPSANRELLARLKLWRLQDHGAVAELAHASTFTAAQRRALERLTARPGAYARQEKLSQAFFPLLMQGPVASPLLPYVIHPLPATAGNTARAIAVAKLRHAPYDEIGVIAEKQAGGWKAVRLVSAVNH